METSNEELVAEIQQGHNVQDNMYQLYMQNMPLIRQTIKPYSSYTEMDDLLQEAYFGLQKAVDKYTPELGNSFITYAKHWIKQSASRYTQNNVHTKRIPSYMIVLISTYKKFISEYQNQFHESPTDSIICKRLDISKMQLNNIIKFEHELNCTSIDAPIKSTDGETTISELIEGDGDIANDVIEHVAHEELSKIIWGFVNQLPEKQKFVITEIYIQNKTMEELSEIMSVTSARIWELKKKAITTLSRKIELKKNCIRLWHLFKGISRQCDKFQTYWDIINRKLCNQSSFKFRKIL